MRISATPKEPMLIFVNNKWQLKGKVTINWKMWTFAIPNNYRCDLGSVPWVFNWIVKSTGKGNLAFLAHDFVYDDDTTLPEDKGIKMDREDADEMMRDLLLHSGLSNWRATVAWRGVRKGGWYSWKKHD